MKKYILRLWNYFSFFEKMLWGCSMLMIGTSFIVFKGSGVLSMITSLIGATSLILCAKGNPAGQAVIVVFSLLYGIISYSFSYYGEMLTYMGMTAPMAVISLIIWLKNPIEESRTQVRIRRASVSEAAIIFLIAIPITVIFYFILKAWGTQNLIPSTLSVTTSALAVAFTARRCALYATAYALNDGVLLVLWTTASFHNSSYIPLVTCFAVFLVNDIYSYYNWNRLLKAQCENRISV